MTVSSQYDEDRMEIFRGLISAISCASILLTGGTAVVAQQTALEYPTVPGHFRDEGTAAPLVATEALLGDTEFYVRYEQSGDVAYSGGAWAHRIPLDDLDDGKVFPGPYIVPLEYRQSSPWPVATEHLVSVMILSSNEWREFRDELFASLMPTIGNEGVVLHFFVDDYFLYYDAAGDFQSSLLQDKPADYSIQNRISFEEFLERGLPLLEAYLSGKEIKDRRIVFNTGDTGAYSLPFLYVNLDLPLGVFARYEPDPVERAPSGQMVPYIQTAGHLARSHSGDIVLRPISSIYRLFFVATDTVRELVTPDYMVVLAETPIPPIHDGPGMNLYQWEQQLDRQTGRPATRGTIEYLVDGEEFFVRLIDAIGAARESIHLRTYIFDNDDFAEKIGELLKRRSNEGIEVRMLFDGLGTIISTIEQQESLPENWQETFSVRKFLESDSEVEVRQAANPWMTGDHVKTIVIDERVAFTGGMNIAREYRYDWHDLMMEVHGPVVDVLSEEFRRAWAHAGLLGDYGYLLQRFYPRTAKGESVGHPLRVLFTSAGDHEIFEAQRQAIRNAKRYIYVENAYFTDDVMLYELVKARRRGVDVRVIMPLVTDRGPITRNNALAANAMLEHGIRVYIYPGMSHVKAAVFDGWACLGSANWDNWSLAINKELNLATSDPKAVGDLIERLFEPDFARSAELTEQIPERWSDYLLELIGDFVF